MRNVATKVGAALALAGARDGYRYVKQYGKRKWSGNGKGYGKTKRYGGQARKQMLSGRQAKRDRMTFDTPAYNTLDGVNTNVTSYVGETIDFGSGLSKRSSAFIYVTGIKIEASCYLTSQGTSNNSSGIWHCVVTENHRDNLATDHWFKQINADATEGVPLDNQSGWQKNTRSLNTGEGGFKVHKHIQRKIGRHVGEVGNPVNSLINEYIRFDTPIKVRFTSSAEGVSSAVEGIFPKIGVTFYGEGIATHGVAGDIDIFRTNMQAVATIHWRE